MLVAATTTFGFAAMLVQHQWTKANRPAGCSTVLQVHYNTDLTHGEFLIKSEVKQAIMGELRAMLARSGNAVVGLARPVLKTTITLVHNALGATKVRLHTTKAGNRWEG
jgi:hypothetical protein